MKRIIVLLVLLIAAWIMSSCKPMSRSESDRIMTSYEAYYDRTRGVKIRK